jgi:hypothetical protein
MTLRLHRSTPLAVCALCLAQIAIVLAPACGDDGTSRGDGGGAGDGGDEPAWTLVFQGLDGALMSIAGTSSSNVWTVGSDTLDGNGALVLHYDGESWTREIAGTDADLWWVHVLDERSIFIGGSGGTLLHYDGASFEPMETPGSSIVFGIWGLSEDDLWAVGGEPDIAPGFVWHYDGSAWTDMTAMLPAEVMDRSLFKVWGRSADDVWLVGMEGVALHWDGAGFELQEPATTRRLFTVHGTQQGEPAFVAVGGIGSGVIVENDGTQWHNVTPMPEPTELFGVFMVSNNEGYAVGYEGTVMQRVGSAWELLDTGVELFNPFHSVWADPDGDIWAVGGDVQRVAPNDGMLLHRGKVVSNEIRQ